MGMSVRLALWCGLAAGVAAVWGGEAAPEDQLVAKVNGQAIYDRTLTEGLPTDTFDSVIKSIKSLKLERAVTIEELRQFFDAQQIQVTEATVDQAIEEQRKTPPAAACACCRYGSFDEFLAANCFSLAEYRRIIRNDKALAQYLEQEWKKAHPGPAALSALTKQKRAAVVAEYVKSWHIFFNVAPPNGPGPAQPPEERIKARAQAVWQQLQSGKTFAELARKQSDDQNTRDNGGYFGYISRTRSPFGQEATAVLGALQNGAYSRPVASPWGWHIFKREDLTDDDVVAIRKEEFIAAKEEEVLNSVRNNAKVEFFGPYKQPPR